MKKKRLTKKFISICVAAVLMFTAALPLTALADPDDGTNPANPPETPPSHIDSTPPPPTPMRPLPDWLINTPNWPSWIYTVDEFPEWFYQLEREPVWFREVDRIPPWFFQIEEIPDWFYQSEDDTHSEMPEFPEWMYSIIPWPSWIYTVEDFPAWFYELEREPVWFREFDSVPPWFYTLSEIPDWFYLEETPEPADDPDDPFRPYDPNNPDDGYNPGDPLSPEYVPDIDDTMPYTVNLGGDLIIFSSVPSGMTTNSEVQISFAIDSFNLTRDGEIFLYDIGEPLTEHGYYELTHIDNPSVIIYSFRIVTRPLNDMTQFTVPNGFVLSSAFYGGEMLKPADTRSADMTQDGEYRFIVSDDRYENSFIIEITLDTTPPQLIFTNRPEDDSEPLVYDISPEGDTELIAPVVFRIADDEENCDILVMLNASSVRANQNTLLEPGLYRVTITDEAGNSTLYTFRILYIVTVPLVWVIIIGSLLIAALTGYLIYNRKNIKVR